MSRIILHRSPVRISSQLAALAPLSKLPTGAYARRLGGAELRLATARVGGKAHPQPDHLDSPEGSGSFRFVSFLSASLLSACALRCRRRAAYVCLR